MDTLKRPFGLPGVIGLLMLAMTMVFLFLFPAKASRLPEGFFTPIIAFEFIRTPQEVDAMFRAPDGSVRQDLVETMNRINRLDYIYMVLYTGFLLTFSLAAARHSSGKFFYLPAGLALMVLFSDGLENLQLLGITARLESGGFEAELARLHLFTWIKWGGIALIFATLFPWFVKGRAFSKVIAMAGLASCMLATAAFLHRSVLNELFSLSVGLMFVLMVIYCFLPARVRPDRPCAQRRP